MLSLDSLLLLQECLVATSFTAPAASLPELTERVERVTAELAAAIAEAAGPPALEVTRPKPAPTKRTNAR